MVHGCRAHRRRVLTVFKITLIPQKRSEFFTAYQRRQNCSSSISGHTSELSQALSAGASATRTQASQPELQLRISHAMPCLVSDHTNVSPCRFSSLFIAASLGCLLCWLLVVFINNYFAVTALFPLDRRPSVHSPDKKKKHFEVFVYIDRVNTSTVR